MGADEAVVHERTDFDEYLNKPYSFIKLTFKR